MRDWIGKLIKNRNGTDFFILILIGVLVLIVAIPAGSGGPAEKQEPAEVAKEVQITEQQAYKRRTEGELKELLETMEGVGKCRVMVTLEDEGKSNPKVVGVVVVAQGGANAVVVSNISRAVMSLFQLEAHKITVVKMSMQEESK